MVNAITPFKFQAPKAFGTNDEIEGLVERMRVLMPVVLDEKASQIQKTNLNNAYIRAAQLSAFYSLIPGVDVHILPFGNGFAVDMGIETWKKAADRYCQQQRITYSPYFVEMTAEELRKRRGYHYDPDDCGYICYIWRSDKEPLYQRLERMGKTGLDVMTAGHGHWAKKAKEITKDGNKVWQQDQIPTQRTKYDVAKRRAFKAALKLEFSLDALLAPTPNVIAENLDYIDRVATRTEQYSQVMQRPEVELDADGFVVTKPQATRQPQPPPEPDYIDGDWTDQDAPDIDDSDPWDEQPSNEPPVQSPHDFHTLASRLTGEHQKLMEWSRTKQQAEGGPASVVDYRILAGEIDKLIGKGNHNLFLGVMLGRHVDSLNVPSRQFVKFLTVFIMPKVDQLDENKQPVRNDKGKKVKIDNPDYRPNVSEAIKEIWEIISKP